MNPGEPRFESAFVELVTELYDRKLTVELTLPVAVMLVAQVQLALRHPDNTGASVGFVRRFLDDLIDQIAAGDETLLTGLRAGFDPAHDVPRPAV